MKVNLSLWSLSPIKVNLEIQCHLKEAETKDITHVDILGNLFIIIGTLN